MQGYAIVEATPDWRKQKHHAVVHEHGGMLPNRSSANGPFAAAISPYCPDDWFALKAVYDATLLELNAIAHAHLAIMLTGSIARAARQAQAPRPGLSDQAGESIPRSCVCPTAKS